MADLPEDPEAELLAERIRVLETLCVYRYGRPVCLFKSDARRLAEANADPKDVAWLLECGCPPHLVWRIRRPLTDPD